MMSNSTYSKSKYFCRVSDFKDAHESIDDLVWNLESGKQEACKKLKYLKLIAPFLELVDPY